MSNVAITTVVAALGLGLFGTMVVPVYFRDQESRHHADVVRAMTLDRVRQARQAAQIARAVDDALRTTAQLDHARQRMYKDRTSDAELEFAKLLLVDELQARDTPGPGAEMASDEEPSTDGRRF